MVINYKPKRHFYYRFTALAVLFVLLVLVSPLDKTISTMAFNVGLAMAGLGVDMWQSKNQVHRPALIITNAGIQNQWGTFGWEAIRNLSVEKEEYLLFQADNEKQQELSFRYKFDELDVAPELFVNTISQYKEIRKT